MNQNNSHLIAGFFRYHREKLNYSLRGLVGDGKVVDLSSLSAFENGKKLLTENQLIWLFKRIEKDYNKVIESYMFLYEYDSIVEYLCLGESQKAEQLYLQCVENDVFESLGAMNFTVLNYVLTSVYDKNINSDNLCLELYNLIDDKQKAIINIAKTNNEIKNGDFQLGIEILKQSEMITYNPKIRAWMMQQFGRLYILVGNFAEATVSLLEAKHRYSEFLGIIRIIQINLNLGTTYLLTNSYEKAEESYLEAFKSSLMLNDSTHLLTKCFNSLCWLYFKTNEYDKVKEFLMNKPDELVESRNTYFVLAWGYYKIGNYEESIKYCEEGLKKFSKYSYVCMVYEYIEKACKGIKTGQDALLRKIIETEDYDNTAEIKELFTYEIIDIYERRKNYEKAFKYAKKLLNR